MTTSRSTQAAVLEAFVADVPKYVAQHRAADGGFVRFAHGDRDRSDPYGVANAIGVLWSVGRLPASVAGREAFARALRATGADDGTFRDPSHGVFHSTALALGSLRLLVDTEPAPVPSLAMSWEPEAAVAFLETRNWDNPWFASHDVAGLAAIGAVTRCASPAWFDTYFRWLDDHVDPTTGLWLQGRMGDPETWPGLFGNLGASFHMHFTYRWHHRLLPEPSALVDTCIDIDDGAHAVGRGDVMGWPELDWAYSIRHAAHESGHRHEEVRDRLDALTRRVVAVLDEPSFASSEHVQDLPALSALVALLAELSMVFPEIAPRRLPLLSVLSGRPFI